MNYSYQLYTSGVSVRIKSQDARRSLTLGRMRFSSGSGGVLSDRLSSRLLGNFEASLYQRRFDGARSVILDQVKNGVAVRMALLYLLAGGAGEAGT